MNEVSKKAALRIYTLGRFSIVRHGAPLPPVRKAPHRPLLLLKALIASGGRQVGIDYLSSLLWPDSEGDRAQAAFGTTLHRLRNYLGGHHHLILEDGCVTLSSESVWVDIWAFERALGGLSRKLVNRDRHGLIDDDAREVLAAYQGHFLEREGMAHWSISTRERLRSKFIHGLLELGRYWEGLGLWDQAIRCYRKGIEVDDLVETFYQRLMLCLAESARKPEAIAVYRQCRQILSVVLGLQPMEETQAIYQSIRSGYRKTG